MREYSQGIVRNPAATDTICDLEMLQMRLAHHANEKLKEQRAERACAFWLKSWKQLGLALAVQRLLKALIHRLQHHKQLLQPEFPSPA